MYRKHFYGATCNTFPYTTRTWRGERSRIKKLQFAFVFDVIQVHEQFNGQALATESLDIMRRVIRFDSVAEYIVIARFDLC